MQPMDEEDDKPLQPYERYVMIPSTFEPGKIGKFRIVLLTAKPLEAPPEFVPPLKQMHVAGAWTESNAGGCRNFYTWRRNEQYSLVLSKPARVSVVLLRHNAEVSDTALHSKKGKSKMASKKKKAKDASNFLIGFVVARAGVRADRKQLHIEDEEIVDRTQFSPAYEAAAEFFSDDQATIDKAPERSYVIVPSTYEPGIGRSTPPNMGISSSSLHRRREGEPPEDRAVDMALPDDIRRVVRDDAHGRRLPQPRDVGAQPSVHLARDAQRDVPALLAPALPGGHTRRPAKLPGHRLLRDHRRRIALIGRRALRVGLPPADRVACDL